MNEFIKAANVPDIPDGGKHLAEVDERLVILFRIGDDFFCIDDVCTHDGGTLSDGELEGCAIECPRHGARFDIRTGEALCMPATQDTLAHEVQIKDGEVWVKLAEEE